jgi:hypothetical protein
MSFKHVKTRSYRDVRFSPYTQSKLACVQHLVLHFCCGVCIVDTLCFVCPKNVLQTWGSAAFSTVPT